MNNAYLSEAYYWLLQSERRKQLLAQFTQPLTPTQLSYRTGFSIDASSHVLWELSVYGLVRCLNEPARSSRLYWLPDLGIACQIKVRKVMGLPRVAHDFPIVDWHLYGWVCFRHRAAVIRALQAAMQPAEIKRRARVQDPGLRMSANNARDVIRLLLFKEVVEPIAIRKKAHPRYQLTEVGRKLQTLLHQANQRH